MERNTMQPRGELLPLRTGFDVVWRGYDREQVDHYVHAVENDLRFLAADRDSAVARADALAQQMQDARAEIAALRDRIDRISRTPVDPAGLTDRLRRMVELAHDEAGEITEKAKAAAERSWSSATEATARLRRRAEHLAGQLERSQIEAEAEHRELMARARAEVEAMTRQAERRRRELDEQAAAVRAQERDDFEQAMALRRAEAMRALAEQERAARARAEQLVREATERAQSIVAEAQHHHTEVTERLHAVQQALTEAAPLLIPQQKPGWAAAGRRTTRPSGTRTPAAPDLLPAGSRDRSPTPG
jgi:cell division septum initiation protein DivIVA